MTDNISALGFGWSPDFSVDSVEDFNPKRSIFRAKKVMAGLVHDMTALEDNPFTFPEVKTLLDGVTVGGHRVSDAQQVINTAVAWKKIFELVETDRFTYSKEIFCEIHGLVAKDEALSWGTFRSGQVRIGGTNHRPPSAEELDQIFETGKAGLVSITSPHVRAFAFFLFGALHQFFLDGNKRTSRLLMAGELLRCGLDIANIPASRKLEFNEKMIRFYDSKDGSEMMEFLKSCLLD